MAATHLTLEEAAIRLGIPADEFKKRLKTDPAFKILVPIRDGNTLRFKSGPVDELARQLGAASDPELPLAPLDEGLTPDSDDFKVPPVGGQAKAQKKASHDPLPLATSDDDIFSLAAESKPEPKPPGKSDSDARLEPGKPKKPKDGSDEAVVPTEEIAIDFSGPGSAVIKGGSSSKLSAPKSGKLSSGKLSASDSGKNPTNPGAGDSSEFELSLDADSDDFELKLNTEASDEVALGAVPKDSGSGSGKRASESGINLRDPADSGISLEKGKGDKGDKGGKPEIKKDSDSDVDFELTLDSSSAASAVKLSGVKGKPADPDSDSEFELTLDDSGGSSIEHAALGAAEAEADKGDIFETDFEIPPMEASDSGSEAVALESDTDLEKSDIDEVIGDSDVVSEEEDTSGSEVVLLEDESDESPKALKGKPGKPGKAKKEDADVDLADEDLEEEESASKALRGAKGRRRDEEEEEEEEAVPIGAGAARPVSWGAFPGIMLLLTFPLMLVGAIVGFELLQTMWGYQQPRKPAAPLVRGLASTLDMPLADQ